MKREWSICILVGDGKVWQGGYHAEIVQSNWFIKQKINYIHNNPVKEKIVTLP